jgi:Domain of unknown function (DUF5655)
MATDYGEKERAFIDGLEENTGRDLQGWMDAISAQDLAHRNDIIDWLRRQGFMFSKASWLERIHHNGGKPIYDDSSAGTPRVRGPRRIEPDLQESPVAQSPPPRQPPKLFVVARSEPEPPQPEPPPPEPSTPAADLTAVLAKAKAYRPLAQAVINRIRATRPNARFEPADTYVSICDPHAFAQLGIGSKELRLHLALGDHPVDTPLQKGVPGGGLGKGQALSHMVVLNDARQIDQRLMDLVQLAATKVNG